MTIEQQKELLLSDINQYGAIRFYDRRALGRWADAISQLQDSGLIKQELREVDEQESYLLITKK